MQAVISTKIDKIHLLKAKNDTFDANCQFHQNRQYSPLKGCKLNDVHQHGTMLKLLTSS